MENNQLQPILKNGAIILWRKINLVIEEPNDPPQNVKFAFESILEAIKCFERFTCGKCKKCKSPVPIGYNECHRCIDEAGP